MFKIPRVNVIESDEGFSVEVLGRTGLKYVQGAKTLFIDSEVLVGQPDMVIYAGHIKNWDTGESINNETKKMIVDNINQAFSWKGATTEVLW